MKWFKSLFGESKPLSEDELNAPGPGSIGSTSKVLRFDGFERLPDGSMKMILDLTSCKSAPMLEERMLEALDP
jgi:hypothetical protein